MIWSRTRERQSELKIAAVIEREYSAACKAQVQSVRMAHMRVGTNSFCLYYDGSKFISGFELSGEYLANNCITGGSINFNAR